MSSPTEVKFDTIRGVPLYYGRYADGKLRRASFYSTAEFKQHLDLWVKGLQLVSRRFAGDRFGTVTKIVCAGVYVNKPGQHGEGTAFDLDTVRWSGGARISPYRQQHASSKRVARRRYLALDATCRRRFRWVLNGWYNAAHEDHIHFDFGGLPTVLSRGSTSDTKFVQAACNNFMGAGLAVDGAWGALTEDAFQRSRRRLQVTSDPFTRPRSWRRYLWRVAMHGFANKSYGYFSYTKG